MIVPNSKGCIVELTVVMTVCGGFDSDVEYMWWCGVESNGAKSMWVLVWIAVVCRQHGWPRDFHAIIVSALHVATVKLGCMSLSRLDIACVCVFVFLVCGDICSIIVRYYTYKFI